MSMVQILKLKPAFTDEQAQALAGLFDEDIATKSDIEKQIIVSKANLDILKAELQADIEKLRSEVQADIEKLRLEVQRDVKALEASIKGTEVRLLRWMTGQAVAIISILFALIKFVNP